MRILLHFYRWLLLGTGLIMLNACQVYHDTTARFNAYFLAKEKMLEVEAALLAAAPNDYGDILMVFPRIDSASGASQKTGLEYVIEKASLPIKFHERSKWVDDCYLLIGKARLYMGDFRNAATTFKYVNTNSPDPDARHTALVWLQRLFIEQDNSKDALYAAEYLSKDDNPINNDNARDFYLNMAHYYRLEQDLPRTSAYLEKALPFITNKEMRIKALFIIAQISQRLGKSEKAYEYYSQLTRSNPPYEILFLSQLNTAGAVNFADEDAVAKADKTLQSLLKDPKNTEYKDRILFEIGSFEVKRGRLQQGLEAYRQSLAATAKPQQKATTYLQMGKVYYERLQDYANAALYYDSASQVLPTSSPDYDAVKRQAGILGEFAEEQAKAAIAERLLRLYAMSDAERKKALEKEIADEKAAIDRQLKTAQQDASRSGVPALPANNFPGASGNSNTWYFYNVQTVANGKTAFARTWGNIPLADNWRLSDKVRDSQPDEIMRPTTANTAEKGKENRPQEADRYAAVKPMDKRLAEIPADEAEAKQVRLALAEALYQTGKMYFQMLEEPQKARANLERFVQLAPDHPKVPEALYTIIRLCSEQKDCQPDAYKRQLLEKYPESSYAQLLNKASGDKNEGAADADSFQAVADAAVVKAYAEAYELYRSGQYAQALDQFHQMEVRYPGNPLSEQISMLKILSRLALEPASVQAENDLKNFITAARRPELVEMAKAVLQKIEERKKP
ncbi:type IX secretion system periplasmic lipoprotein PorW/SprE [Rhodoflexus caldus]|uniref:type IX secretion system periplasmic lipoprotein PorW/SprE n=1 Tax=Rhodoflexus caldus TaxID=2891236 RepID=UPI00202A94A8|nr:tetratricopeptide repeat protein [Rhodoflexus caldus]